VHGLKKPETLGSQAKISLTVIIVRIFFLTQISTDVLMIRTSSFYRVTGYATSFQWHRWIPWNDRLNYYTGLPISLKSSKYLLMFLLCFNLLSLASSIFRVSVINIGVVSCTFYIRLVSSTYLILLLWVGLAAYLRASPYQAPYFRDLNSVFITFPISLICFPCTPAQTALSKWNISLCVRYSEAHSYFNVFVKLYLTFFYLSELNYQ
jgi:hypothetical protein